MNMIKVARPLLDQEELDAACIVLKGDRFVSGPQVELFEQRLAEIVGVEHAVAVNSGTAALHLALLALGLQPGDEVIVPSLTFFSTATSVIHAGGVPVFADIDPTNYGLSAESVAEVITDRTRAAIPVHFMGYPADMEALRAVCEPRGVALLEDCAQAHGSAIDGRVVGSIGEAGAFSFFATKHVTTGGEGGAIVTNDAELAATSRLLRSHGLEGRDDHVMLGYNFRMPEVLGAVGAVQLGRLEGFNRRRIANSERLLAAIGDVEWLRVPDVPDNITHTYFWCHVEIDEEALGRSTRDLVGELADNGVEVRHRYTEPLYRQPMLTTKVPEILRFLAGDRLPDYGSLHLPNVERIAGSLIGLPNRPDMSEDEVDRVVDVVRGINR